jgi:hypothetical protein
MLSLNMPPPSHSHPVSHQSPSTAVPPNMEWAIRDDPFVVVPPPYQHQYRPYSGPVYQPTPSQRDAGQETHTGGYGAGRGRYDGEGSGWKSDRGYGNGEYRGIRTRAWKRVSERSWIPRIWRGVPQTVWRFSRGCAGSPTSVATKRNCYLHPRADYTAAIYAIYAHYTKRIWRDLRR